MIWSRAGSTEVIGLIAGAGEFPVEIAKAAASEKRPVVLFGLQGHVDERAKQYVLESHPIVLGELDPLFQMLKEKKIRQVVLAGAVPKKKIYDASFKMDGTAQGLVGGARNKGDDHLLRAFSLLLKARCGASVVDARRLLKKAVAPKGVLTRRSPTEAEWQDLKLGLKVARHVGKMDIGQTVVIKNGVVLAVEAIEGTDQAIRRAGELGVGGVIVVKVAKPNQDLRFDLPCAGTRTLDSLKNASSCVLGVEAGKTLLIEREKMLKMADENDMTIVGL